MKILKVVSLAACALFFAFGATLWIWVAYTQSNPKLAQAAYQIALGPACASILLALKARAVSKPDYI